jgi:hypothetical protein
MQVFFWVVRKQLGWRLKMKGIDLQSWRVLHAQESSARGINV